LAFFLQKEKRLIEKRKEEDKKEKRFPFFFLAFLSVTAFLCSTLIFFSSF